MYKPAEVLALSSDKEDGHEQADHEVDFDVLNNPPSLAKFESMRPLRRFTEAGALVGKRAQFHLQPGLARASDLETVRQQDEWLQWSSDELRRNVSELERQDAAMRGCRETEQQ